MTGKKEAGPGGPSSGDQTQHLPQQTSSRKPKQGIRT